MDLAQLKTTINTDKKRFELEIDGHLAFIEYILNNKNVVYLVHTEVPSELEGKGIGNKMVREALNHIEEKGYKLAPLCPFVAAFVKRHEEYKPLMAEGFNV